MRIVTIGLLAAAVVLALTGCQTVPPPPTAGPPPPHAGGPAMMDESQIAATVIAMERAALNRWAKGDPSGFLEIAAPDIVYFDPSLAHRLDGLPALTRLYEGIRGQLNIDRFELLNPKVQVCGGAAVLTFNFISYVGEKINRWNCTEVYRQAPEGWRIIQTHWSVTQPFQQ